MGKLHLRRQARLWHQLMNLVLVVTRYYLFLFIIYGAHTVCRFSRILSTFGTKINMGGFLARNAKLVLVLMVGDPDSCDAVRFVQQ